MPGACGLRGHAVAARAGAMPPAHPEAMPSGMLRAPTGASKQIIPAGIEPAAKRAGNRCRCTTRDEGMSESRAGV